MAPVRRLALALVTPLVATLLIAAPAAAQSTFTWNTSSDAAWLTASNWSASTSFPGFTANSTGNNAGDTAAFGSTRPSGDAVNIDMTAGGANGLLQVGAITFSNTTSTLVVGSTPAGTLRLNG